RSKYLFYDLVKLSNRHPQHNSLPVSLLENIDGALAKEAKTARDEDASEARRKAAEAKIAKVFGGRIKGEDRKSSSRINVGKPRVIGGVKVPHRPLEPDNCCMSGCINCVWEMYNDDVKDWNTQRKKAAAALVAKGGVWPEDFHPPIELLKPENLPPSLALQARGNNPKGDEEPWDKVPVQIRVFAEMEKKIKAKQK
ncbi:hypothetical protein METBIDRAFT_20092, partial [Metschnikowia bicuspidata var. bicuspidata NRRL YB-4993]